MQRVELEKIVENYDKIGDTVNDAIMKDNADKLDALIKNSTPVDPDQIAQQATALKSWKCLLYLMQTSAHYDLMRYSKAFLIACKENNTLFLNHFINLLNKKIFHYHTSGDSYSLPFFSIFFTNKKFLWINSRDLVIDSDSGYSALHWCVINDNASLLDGDHRFLNGDERQHYYSGNYDFFYNAELDVLYAKDRNGRTAFDLALMLGRNECASALAKHMELGIMVSGLTVLSLKNILKLHIDFKKPAYQYQCTALQEQKSALLTLIDTLDNTSKEEALKQALDPSTSIGNLMLRFYCSYDKYSQVDFEMKASLAKRALDLINEKEKDEKLKQINKPSSSTAQIKLNFFAQPQEANEDQPFLKPVYIEQSNIPNFLSTTQFNAIIRDTPPILPNKSPNAKIKAPGQ